MRDVRSFRSVVLVAALVSCGRLDRTSIPPGDAIVRPVPSTGHGLLVSSPGSQVEEEYGYDGAGELISIRTSGPPVPLALSDFDPKEGGTGQLVSVAGAGFSPDPGRNVVRLNGTVAAVVASSATRVSFKVPADAATGRITVSVGTATATSAVDFVVSPPVVVSDFAPKMGKAGTVLTISGNGFDPEPARNIVSIGGRIVTVTSASSTSLVGTVSSGASSGKVSVSTASSSATSSGDFVLLPEALVEQDTTYVGRTEPEAPVAVAIPTAGKSGILLFDGVEGRSGSVHVSSVTYAGTTRITIFEPLGTAIFTSTVSAGQERKLAVPALPRTGTYVLVVQPAATSTGTATLRVFEDAVVALDPRGGSATMTLARGRNGRFVFTARPGDRLDVGMTSLVVSPAGATSLALLQPDGASLGTQSISTRTNWQLPVVELPGLHSLTVSPPATADASLTLALSVPLTGKFPAGGASVHFESARTGQTGWYTLEAAAGESYTLKAVAGTGFTSNVTVAVYRPTGASVGNASVPAGSSNKIDLSDLPETGPYTVAVTPQGTGTGSLDLTLIPEATGTLVLDEPPRTLSLMAAQNGRYTFAGSAGDYLSVGYTAISITPSGGSVMLMIRRPDGIVLTSRTVNSLGSWQLPVLPSTGTYTISVTPPGTSAANITILLSRPVTGPLANDGSATRFESARAGQTGRYTFEAATGESYTVTAIASAGFTGGAGVAVHRPSGPLAGTVNVAPGGKAKLDLGVLPEAGTYTVVVIPPGVGTGAVDLRVLPYALDSLGIGDPPKALSLLPGQNGRYTFDASQGDLLQLAFPSFVTTPSGKTATIILYGPNGSALGNRAIGTSGTWSLPQIPESGTHQLTLKLPDTAGANLSLQLTRR